MDEAVQRRTELDRASIAPSQYKPPSRVTLNEAKLANYVKDLADPSVPLTRLSRSVPHGFRGEKLFEMLWAGGALPAAAASTASGYFNPRVAPLGTASTPSSATTPGASIPSSASAARKSVDISRAVWFIRALGVAELSSLRNKSAATIVPEITSNLCTWMAKQVTELTLVQAAESSSTAAASPAPFSPSSYLPRTPGAGPPTSLSRSVATAHIARTPSNLHPAASPSPAPGKEVCSVLQNEVDEERWLAKWSYSLSLARHLHAQNLLDRAILVRWIVDAFAASNLVQLPFLIELVQEVLTFILRRRCFVKPFLTALLIQISSLDARFDRTTSPALRTKLMLLFRIVCETSPDALVSPRLWSEHADTLTQLLAEVATDADGLPSEHATQTMSDFVEHVVKPRVDRLLLRPANRQGSKEDSSTATSSPATATLQQHLDMEALDSFDMRTIDRVFLQTSGGNHRHTKQERDDSVWAPRIETILSWACSDRRSGVARQYLAATLIEKIRFGVTWEESSEETDQVSLPAFDLEHHTKKTRKINVEPMLIKWLGDVEASLSPISDGVIGASHTSLLATIDVTAIVVLVGELARRGIFSYTKYLQRLIARGMTTASASSAGNDACAVAPPSSGSLSRDSLHLRLLRSLPLYDQPASVYQQRRQAIYGDRTKETYEDAVQRRALRQLQSFLPFAFVEQEEQQESADPPAASHPASVPEENGSGDLEQALSRLWSASRFVRCRIFRNELLPAVTTRIERINGNQLSMVSAVLVMADDFEGLAQLLATLLLRPLSDSLARATFNMVIEHSLVWRSMDIMGTLNQLVRQQLNHSSSVRNDRQAVMASTTLLRLRTLIEGIPGRISAPALDPGAETDAIHQHVQALRPSVDTLLDRFANISRVAAEATEAGKTPPEGSDILTPFRSLFLQSDATGDEVIERTIVESVLARSDHSLVPAAVRLIDQLYLEASLEIDERHARWLSHLAHSIEQGTHGGKSIGALLALLTRLIAHGTLNLQLAMDAFLLPSLLSSVRRLTDPATRGTETSSNIGAIARVVSEIFSSVTDEVTSTISYEDMRAFGAQTMLLFAHVNLPSLLGAASCLICASDAATSIDAADKASIETFWKALLRSQPMQIAFRQDPRLCILTIKDTCKSMWGCNPSRVIDLAMGCLDPTSLLLQDVASVDAASIKARLDGWDTAVVAKELVEIFERLQLVESSFQSRADSKTKALASGIFDDLFVRLPATGAQVMRDCQSSGLISRFTDIGIKILSDKVKASKAATEGSTLDSRDAAKDSYVETAAPDEPNPSSSAQTGSSTAPMKSSKPSQEDEGVDSTMRSVLRMCEQQDSFTFNATDADSCGQLLLHVVSFLEHALSPTDSRTTDVATQLLQLLHSGTFQLLHLVLRFGCLWSVPMKAVAQRLVKSLLDLTRQAGQLPDCSTPFTLLLDSLSFVLDELPAQLLSACLPELETQLAELELATHERTSKMQQLSFRLDNAAGQWLVASSAESAVRKGWFTAGGLNAWECAEYLDAPPTIAPAASGNAVRGVPLQTRPIYARPDPASQTDAAAVPGARTGWSTKLTLNTSIPLTLLGLRVTRDLVPNYSTDSPSATSVGSNAEPAPTQTGLDATLPVFVESERTYGGRVGGEPAFARDVRRGLLLRPTLPVVQDVSTAIGQDGIQKVVSGTGRGSEKTTVGLTNDAIPVIDLKWDDDEVMPLQQPPAVTAASQGSRKRRMSKRD
uniref:Mediator of RNA polymerase II transcription subunit 12 n=2 Tax=Kalmanozyma brasiliensis (strain GHG001) TaxID=1365824 RepID=V5EY32_KALBG